MKAVLVETGDRLLTSDTDDLERLLDASGMAAVIVAV